MLCDYINLNISLIYVPRNLLQVKRLSEHTGIVNSCCPLQRGPQLFVSGGDDSRVKVCWAYASVIASSFAVVQQTSANVSVVQYADTCDNKLVGTEQ